MNNPILKLPELTRRQVRKLAESPRLDDEQVLRAARRHIAVMVWDDEDEDGVPFRASVGYVIGMKIVPETGALLIYAYTPNDGFRYYWKHAVAIPHYFLPQLLFKLDEGYYIGKLMRFLNNDCTVACVYDANGNCYEVQLSDIAVCSDVKLGLEVVSDSNSNDIEESRR